MVTDIMSAVRRRLFFRFVSSSNCIFFHSGLCASHSPSNSITVIH